MVHFNNVLLTTYLGLEHGRCVAGSESSHISSKNILMCVLKMNEGLTDLELHEGAINDIIKHFGLTIPLNSILFL